MAPTRREIEERVSRLPEHLQKAVRDVLREGEGGEKILHSGSREPPKTATGSLLPHGEPRSREPVPWPGYLHYLTTAPLEVVREIAVRGNYWRLTAEERARIRARLGWTSLDLIAARDRAANPRPS